MWAAAVLRPLPGQRDERHNIAVGVGGADSDDRWRPGGSTRESGTATRHPLQGPDPLLEHDPSTRDAVALERQVNLHRHRVVTVEMRNALLAVSRDNAEYRVAVLDDRPTPILRICLK